MQVDLNKSGDGVQLSDGGRSCALDMLYAAVDKYSVIILVISHPKADYKRQVTHPAVPRFRYSVMRYILWWGIKNESKKRRSKWKVDGKVLQVWEILKFPARLKDALYMSDKHGELPRPFLNLARL